MARGARGKIDLGNLLSLVDILQVIRACANLRALQPFDSYGKFSALCPFHNERKASFIICPIRQEYHCYGCGTHGNAISFVRDHLDSDNPIIDLAKLAVKKRWCTWSQIRGHSPSSMMPKHDWIMREYVVLDYYVAPGCPRSDVPFPGLEEGSLDINQE